MEALGAVNQYVPYKRAGRPVFTINLAAGVTPFIKYFGGVEYSSQCYRVNASPVTATYGWFRPTRPAFDLLPDEPQQHVLNGGLLCEPLADALTHNCPDGPAAVQCDFEEFQAWCLAYYGRRLPPMQKRS